MFPAGGSGRGVRAFTFQRVMALSKPSFAMSPAASAAPALRKALADPSAAVRIEAAGALVAIGDDEKALQTLATELQGKSADAAVHAARTLQLLGKRSRPLRRTIETVLRQAPQSEFPPDTRLYLRFSLEPLVQAFDQP